MANLFAEMKKKVSEMPVEERALLCYAIAQVEAERHQPKPAYYAWNKVCHAIDHAQTEANMGNPGW